MASQAGVFNVQEFTDLGALAVGGRLYTYSYGTTTFKAAYTDAAGLVSQTYTNDGLGGQYIALNSRGELPAPLYLTTGSYDLTLKTAAGATVWTRRADGMALVSDLGLYGDPTWVTAVAGGVFDYLRTNALLAVSSDSHGLGFSTFARTSVTGGTAGEAALTHGSFAYNDKLAGSVTGAWGGYATAVRASGVLGPTHATELDIANWGATVPLYPSSMFPAGQTHGLWTGSGGESAATPGLCGTASAAWGVISNDPLGVANFDAIIVVHNKAINGVDGTGGTAMGTFAKLPSGAQTIWFNNTTQAVGEVVCSGVTFAGAQRLDLSDFGFLIADRNSGKSHFLVDKKANAVNYLAVGPAIAGVDPLMEARGDDTNLNLILLGKGTGYVGSPNPIKALKDTAIPAGGTAGYGFTFSATANFGMFFGSGVPSLTAAKGSLYLCSNGSSSSTRAYINTDGGTTWTNLVTAA